MRDDPAWMAAENRRMERMAQFEQELVISGYFNVAEEVIPRRTLVGLAADSGYQAGRPAGTSRRTADGGGQPLRADPQAVHITQPCVI